MKPLKSISVVFTLAALQGCVTTHAPLNLPEKQAAESSRLTLATVQQTVKKGATKDDVVLGLGSPNMVTSSSGNTETWVYDRISTEVQTERSSGGVSVLGGGAGSSAGGLIGGGVSSGATAAVRTQRSLTIVIKFVNGLVDSYQTRATSF
jgi:outer membrane protein assembly factor BamE (lipoprotein component of BamABCDE complex)